MVVIVKIDSVLFRAGLLVVGLATMIYCVKRSVDNLQELGQRREELRSLNLFLQASELRSDVQLAILQGLEVQVIEQMEKKRKIEIFFNEREFLAESLIRQEGGAAVEEWRAGGVPDAVRWLYENPGCDNAADCYQSMRPGDALLRAPDSDGWKWPDGKDDRSAQ